MTREEAIKFYADEIMLLELAPTINGDNGSSMKEEWKRQADIHRLAISALREQPRWIPVEERLPENKDHDWVLAQVVEDSGYAHIPKVMEYRQNRNDWFEETYGWISEHNGAFKVTHWMPLPEPPKEEV